MRESAELAARLEAVPGTSWYADAQVALGVARWLSGATQRALHPLAVGAREGSVCNPSAELAALGYLALIAADEAEWDVAAEYEGRATDLLAALGFGTHRRCLPMLLTRVKLRSRVAGAEGEAAAADVARLLRHMVPHPWMALLADVVLGEGAVDRADMAAAERHALGRRSLAGQVLRRGHPAAPRRAPARGRGAHARSRGAAHARRSGACSSCCPLTSPTRRWPSSSSSRATPSRRTSRACTASSRSRRGPTPSAGPASSGLLVRD